jgi:4-hydroxy-2-oxoheptanedioate aldolase
MTAGDPTEAPDLMPIRHAVAWPNPLLERWREGGSVVAAWLTIPDVVVAEMLARSGADAVVVDQQHGGATARDLAALFMAIEVGGAAAITRVPENSVAAIGRSLDAGALAIVVPMVNTAEEAAAAVAACRHGAAGTRSHGPLRPHAMPGPADPADPVRPAVILQIETTAALHDLDAIASTPGVDALLVGPNDLALSLGMPVDPSARSAGDRRRHAEALELVRDACVAHGIAAGMYCTDGAAARDYLEGGFRFVSAATDAVILAEGVRHEIERAGVPRT